MIGVLIVWGLIFASAYKTRLNEAEKKKTYCWVSRPDVRLIRTRQRQSLLLHQPDQLDRACCSTVREPGLDVECI